MKATARAYTVPTERPESDGTLEWDSTTIVVVRVHAGPTCRRRRVVDQLHQRHPPLPEQPLEVIGA